MVIIPGGPGLADTRMETFWILLELRVMEVVVTTAVRRRAMLQSNCHHDTIYKPTSNIFTGQMPFLSPNQQCQSTEGQRLKMRLSNLFSNLFYCKNVSTINLSSMTILCNDTDTKKGKLSWH